VVSSVGKAKRVVEYGTTDIGTGWEIEVSLKGWMG